MTTPPKAQSTIIGCGALLLWAASLPFGKRCSEDIGPLTTVCIVYFVSGVLGVFYFIATRQFKSFIFFRNWQFYTRTILFGLYCTLIYFAIGIIPRENFPIITLLNYMWPTFTMLFSVILLKQKCRLQFLLLGSIIVVFGLSLEIFGDQFLMLVSSSKDLTTLLACISALMAAIIWGLYTVLNRKWGTLAGGPQALPFVLLISSFGLMVLKSFFSESSNITSGTLFPLIYLCLTPFIANICWDIGTRLGNINLLSLLADGLPWVSLTITQIYLGVPIGSTTWISAVIIVIGAVISRYSVVVTQERNLIDKKTEKSKC